MNIFFLPLILLAGPPVLLARWALIKCGIREPENWQIGGALFGAVLVIIWISGIWLAP